MKKAVAVFILLLIPAAVFGEQFSLHLEATYQPGEIGVSLPIPVIGFYPVDGFGWEFGLFVMHFDIYEPDLSNPIYMEFWSRFIGLLKQFGSENFYPVFSIGVKMRTERLHPLAGVIFGAGAEISGKRLFFRGMATYNCLSSVLGFIKNVDFSVGMGLRF